MSLDLKNLELHASIRQQAIRLVEPVLIANGYECRDIVWDNHEKVLSVFIDRATPKVKMEDCHRVGRLLNELQTLDEVVPSAFRLEVSSPGIERPLRTQAHFASEIGQNIVVYCNNQKVQGTLKTVDDAGVITLETSGNKTVQFEINKIMHSHILFDWTNYGQHNDQKSEQEAEHYAGELS